MFTKKMHLAQKRKPLLFEKRLSLLRFLKIDIKTLDISDNQKIPYV
jgi:hypothetical protein